MNFLINKCFSVLYIFMYMNFILFFVKNLVILNKIIFDIKKEFKIIVKKFIDNNNILILRINV